MALIVYSSIKGGVGKTTFAVEHGVHLFDQGRRVALIDADSLQLSSQWVRKVEQGVTVRQATDPARLAALVDELRLTHDDIVADCPGAAGPQTVSLLKRADLALMPIMASPLDLLASIQGAVALIRQLRAGNHGRPDARLIVNGVDGRRCGLLKQIRIVLPRLEIPALRTFITRLAPINDAFAEDTVVTRMGWKGRRAAGELGRLFVEVGQVLQAGDAARKTAHG